MTVFGLVTVASSRPGESEDSDSDDETFLEADSVAHGTSSSSSSSGSHRYRRHQQRTYSTSHQWRYLRHQSSNKRTNCLTTPPPLVHKASSCSPPGSAMLAGVPSSSESVVNGHTADRASPMGKYPTTISPENTTHSPTVRLTLIQCRLNVGPAVPTLNRHWINVTMLVGPDNTIMLICCRLNVRQRSST